MNISFEPARVRKLPHYAGFALFIAISGCSLAGEPYYLGRWEAKEVQEREVSGYIFPNDSATGLPLLHVCYNKMLHSPESVRQLVLENCSEPKLIANESDIASCALATPIRATFLCTQLSREAAEARPNLRRTDSYTGAIQFDTPQ